jgi:hypothetical protein
MPILGNRRRCGGGTACSGPATPARGQRLVDVGDLVAECLCDMGFPDVDGPVDGYRSPGVELAQRGKSRSIAKVDSCCPRP